MLAKTFTALFALSSTALAQDSGLKMSLDISVIEQAKDVYFAKILEPLAYVPIQDFGDGDAYIHENHLEVDQAVSNVNFSVDVAKNAIVLTCSDLSATFYSNKFRKEEAFLVAKGDITVDMNTVTIGMGLSFSTQEVNGHFVPFVVAVDTVVDIDKNDIRIDIDGNIWSDLADSFTRFFRDSIVDVLVTEINEILVNDVPKIVNNAMVAQKGYTAIPTVPHWFLDWQTPNPAVITSSSFEIGSLALMYDDIYGEAEWYADFTPMPYKDTTEAAQFQAFLSDESVDSLMGSWLEIGDIAFWLNGDNVPLYSGTITADLFDVIFYGFSNKYGADAIVDIRGEATALHDFASSAADQGVSVFSSVNLQFWPRFNGTTELAVELNLIDMTFTGQVAINDFVATAQVDDFHVDQVDIPVHTVLTAPAATIKTTLNHWAVLDIIQPTLNGWLAKYQVPIPRDILGIFILSDLFLSYEDGYLFAGATPTFIAPATPAIEPVAQGVATLLQNA